VQEFQDIVGVIILLATPLSLNALSQLINLPREDVSYRLDGFHSVLSIPEDVDLPIRILHLSFRDFLVKTKSRFQVNEAETHHKMALHCFRVRNTRLKHNICGLPSYGTLQKYIDGQVVNKLLSADLQYCCLYWVHHLQQSKVRMSESQASFLEGHFLHWLEVLSLMGVIPEAVGMIETLQSGIDVSPCIVYTRAMTKMKTTKERGCSIFRLSLRCKKLSPADHSG
jgi:hypothetical protein